MDKLDDKVAAITGANSGIGLASAKRFAQEGARVFMTGRRQREPDAAVAEVGSGAGGVQGDITGSPASSVYSASKAAVRTFARNWMLELAARRVRVNVLVPGAISTPGLRRLSTTDEARRAFVATMEEQVPLGRIAIPEEIAAAALFLASDESFVNGSELFADGGQAQV